MLYQMDQVNIIESPVETLQYRIVRPLRVRLSKERGATSLRVDMNPLTETAASVYEPVRAEVVDRHAPVSRKRLCRVVFKDATCTSVDALGTLGEVMDTIYGALTPLRLMLSAGWVHRDINTGNIMAHYSGSVIQAKLCDLEYARKFPPDGGGKLDDSLTGTPYFMPREIINGSPMFRVDCGQITFRNRLETREERRAMFKENKEKEAAAASKAAPEKSSEKMKEPFAYNFQHDVESIYWVSLWNVTARVDHAPSRSFARRVFRNEYQTYEGRREAFLQNIQFDLLEALDPRIQPTPTFALFLEDFRSALIREYCDRQSKFNYPNVSELEEYAIMHIAMESAFCILEVEENTEWRKVALPSKLAIASEAAARAVQALDASQCDHCIWLAFMQEMKSRR